MKGDTALDYVEFQLTPPRTRCELFVSAEGVTEKLASGFLKPFLTHLRAAEQQIAGGCQTIRLECPLNLIEQHGKTWFTKGTLERFVRFVSTPEVLERVKTIEDELAQLEQVRSIQASSLMQTEDGFLGADTTISRTDGKPILGLSLDRNGASIMPRRYPFDSADSGVEASKRELLRAMDVRLLALQQEQNMAFTRAAAAGFDSVNMADLLAFSEHFGADRLRGACIQFVALSRKRQEAHIEPSELDSQATSSGSDMSLASATGADLTGETEVTSRVKPRNSYEARFDAQRGSWDPEGGEILINGGARTKVQERGGFTADDSWSRDQGNAEARKRWGPPESLRPRAPALQGGTVFGSSKDTTRGIPQYNHPDDQISRERGQHDQRSRESEQDEPRSSKLQASNGTSHAYSEDGFGCGMRSLPATVSSSILSSSTWMTSSNKESANVMEETRGNFAEQSGVFSPSRASHLVEDRVKIDSHGFTAGMLDELAGRGVLISSQHERTDSALPSRASFQDSDAKWEQFETRGGEIVLDLSREKAANAWSSMNRVNSAVCSKQHNSGSTTKDGMLYSRLQRMAQQVDASKSAEGVRDSMQSTSSGFSGSDEAQAEINASVSNSSNWQELTHSPGSNSPSQLTFEEHNRFSPDRDSQSQADMNRSFPQRSSSPKRRSASPLRRVQIGRSGVRRSGSVVIRSINYFSSQERPNREKNSTNGSESSDSEDNINDGCADESAPAPVPARRLSVQAAISLFESKQRKDSIEAPLKQRQGKQESSRGSLEGGNSSSSGRAIPRRWSAVNDLSAEVSSRQERDTTSDNEGTKTKLQTDDPRQVHGEFAYSVANRVNFDLSETSGESRCDQPEKGVKESLDATSPGTSKKCSQQSNHSSAIGLPAGPEAGSDKQWSLNQQQTAGGDSMNALEGEWRRQFKMELEKSLTREAMRKDPPSTISSFRSEVDSVEVSSLSKKRLAKTDVIRPTDSEQLSGNSTVTNGSASPDPQEKYDFSTDSKQSQTIQDGSIVTTSHTATQEHANKGWRTASHSEPQTSLIKERHSIGVKGVVNKDITNLSTAEPVIKSDQSMGRESLGSSWIAPLDFDMQALVKMVDHQSLDDGSPDGQKGRFYDQYRKLRDAKLMEEQVSKRAEREAKLKSMEETLERRKAEMDARTARLSKKDNQAQFRAEKLQALKAGLYITKKEQEEGEEEQGTDQEGLSVQTRDQPNTHSSPTSPSSTPHASKDQAPTPKPHVAKKVAPASQKAAMTPRSSTRAATSVSPRSTPKSSMATPSSQRRSAISGITDNPLARSVPCFADLRKENTKPTPGRASGSARVHPNKNNGHPGRSRTVSEAAPLEANGNLSAHNASRNGTGKEDKKRRSMLTRKSCATVSELKALSTQGDEGMVLAPLKAQREGSTEPAIYSKVRRSAVAPIQEVKPFLRKGRGIGPGAGPGVMKLKASSAADAAKSSDEEAPATPTLNADSNDCEGQNVTEVLEAVDPVTVSVVHNSEGEIGTEADASLNLVVTHSSNSLSSMLDDQTERSEVTAVDAVPEDTSEFERSCHTISFPIDFETQKRYATFVANLGPVSQSTFPEDSCVKQADSALPVSLSQLLAEGATESGQCDAVATASTSFRASSLPHELAMNPYSPAAASPASSCVLRPGTISDHFSPSSAVALESPLGSPASWNSSQIQYASEVDVARTRKKWGGSQKPIIVVTQPPKEPAKGLKRLLKFGRKSRASEMTTTDWVSASTTSEGDDDSEEPRDLSSRSADDLLRRARLQDRSLDFGNSLVAGDRYSTQDQGTIQSLRSSIPAPPANFRLRDDHLSGGTLLKAPRSFFSLSSFRSRGSEGKSR